MSKNFDAYVTRVGNSWFLWDKLGEHQWINEISFADAVRLQAKGLSDGGLRTKVEDPQHDIKNELKRLKTEKAKKKKPKKKKLSPTKKKKPK